jgi:hypothetical protein
VIIDFLSLSNDEREKYKSKIPKKENIEEKIDDIIVNKLI